MPDEVADTDAADAPADATADLTAESGTGAVDASDGPSAKAGADTAVTAGPPSLRPTLGAQRAAAARRSRALEPDAGRSTGAGPDPGQPSFVAPAPRPALAMWVTSWPVMACAVLAAVIFGLLFPYLGILLVFLVPLAVGAAFALAAVRSRGIRLEIGPRAVRVTNDRAGYSCEREHVASAVLVERLSRSPLRPATTDAILCDFSGRSLLVIPGLLFPPAVLDSAMAELAPVPMERVTGRQTPATLGARFPRILVRTDGGRTFPAGGKLMLAVVIVLFTAAAVLTARVFL